MESKTLSSKHKLFELLNEQSAEVIQINHQKLVEKNVMKSNTFNVTLKGEEIDYKKINNLNLQMVKEKIKDKTKSTHNITTNSLKIGDVVPMKNFLLRNKIYSLPNNRLNVFIVFSRNYEFVYEKIEKFLTLLKTKNYISTLQISLNNYFKDGLIENSQEFILLKRLFNIDDLPFALVYDKNYRIIYKGNFSELIEEKILQEVFNLNNNFLKSNNTEDIQAKLSSLNLHNQNLIENEQKEEYQRFIEKLKTFNRKDFKENKCKLKKVEIKFKIMKKYSFSADGQKVKGIFKPFLDFNEHATVRNKTGIFIDELTMNFKNILNMVAHDLEEDNHNSIKSVFNFLQLEILKPLNIDNKLLFGIQNEESLGFCKRTTKYKIFNKTAYNDLIDLNTYFNCVISPIENYCVNGVPVELNAIIKIVANYFNSDGKKFIAPYYDENMNELNLEYTQGESRFIYLIPICNPIFLEMVASNAAIIQNLKKIHKENNFLQNLKTTVALFINKQDIPAINSDLDFIKMKNHLKDTCEFIFVDSTSHYTQWLQYTNLQEISGLLLNPQGEKVYFSSDNLFTFENNLKSNLFYTKNYKIDKKTYDELKEYGKKLLKVKFNSLEYNPYFIMNFKTEKDVKFINDDYETNDINCQVNFSTKLRRKDRHLINPFILKIKNILNLDEDLEISEEVYDVIDIELGKECHKCSKTLKGLGEIQFYCYWCNIHFCEVCGNDYHPMETDLAKKLPHEHYLTIINVKDHSGLKNIEIYKFGQNIWKDLYLPNCHFNSFECNSCMKNSGNQKRFICLSCRPGPPSLLDFDHGPCGFADFCQDCFDIIMNGNWKDNFEMRKNLSKDNHDLENHVYLIVDYQTGSYYTF